MRSINTGCCSLSQIIHKVRRSRRAGSYTDVGVFQEDYLDHYHTSLEGDHRGEGETYQQIRAKFDWTGLHQNVQRYVGECVDRETGNGYTCNSSACRVTHNHRIF